ncbi:MAG TPA: hypothetical protein VN848_13475 [Gemmatimonadales bacterium]|nr:hypothetical protein [Gemmatimonadales bacterium]
MALLLTAAACQQGPDAATKAKLAELTKAATERDRLLSDVAQNDRMMSEISSALAHVHIPRGKVKTTAESPLGASRDSMVQEISYVTARVNEAEHKLHESEQKIASLTSLSDSLRHTLEATVANYDSVISQEKVTLAAMSARLDSLTAENGQLLSANGALTDTTRMLKLQNNTVYYIVGTKADLVRRGIIREVGGSRFPLLFAKVGATLVPSRALDPKDFTAINKREVTEIPLSSDRTYRIASLQDVDGLATPVSDNRVSGTLRIGNPDRFWSGSKFLILVQG